MDFFDVLNLIGGLCLFLFGMNVTILFPTSMYGVEIYSNLEMTFRIYASTL